MPFLRRLLKRATPMLPSVQAYQLWAALYPPRAHNPFMALEETAMLDLMPDVRGKTVLDLACGTGRYGIIARERGATTVLGVDNSPAMLQHGQLPYMALGALPAIPLANAVCDVVLCGLALGHVADIAAPINEISRVLKHGGAALISDFHPFGALRGGQRSFTGVDGNTYAVEHHIHLYSHYHAAAQRAGLRITHVSEPTLPAQSIPVVLVLRLEK